MEDDLRNHQIATDVIEAVNAGRTPIILTQRTDHVSVLADLIKNQCNVHVITLVGADSTKQKHETMDTLENIHGKAHWHNTPVVCIAIIPVNGCITNGLPAMHKLDTKLWQSEINRIKSV